MMKAYICPKYGNAEVLKLVECKIPVIKPNEVLIKVYSTSVTNSDIFIRSSKVNLGLIIPFRLMIGIFKPRKIIIGQVFSGVVEKVGNKVHKLNIGDKVYGLTGFSLGAYADYLCLKELNSKQGCVALMPDNISFEEATSVAYGGLLAMQFLEKKVLKAGEKILVYGASGTSGVFATQYLKSIGLIVSCACRENKFEFIKSLGADKMLDYTNAESISKIEKYDYVFDCVGKAKKSELKIACKRTIKDKNNYFSIDDEALLLDSNRLLRIKDLVQKNIIKPINDRTYSFDQMIEAHIYVEKGHKTGNVAITVNHLT